ncbi:MAG: hypothetical protein U1E02_35340, partial [Hydrogenophaga sp.]|nr:hypothetical protein [Hydrogenophaga sp.]
MRDLRSDMEKLRQGDTVSDKLSRLTFKVWAKDEQGQLEARDVIIWLTARDALARRPAPPTPTATSSCSPDPGTGVRPGV